MQTAPARLVRRIERGESIADLINEAKGRVWEFDAEQMAVRLATGERMMVEGGRDGIDFIVEEGPEGPTLHMVIDGRRVRVLRIYGHTHPHPTGPSDGDQLALAILGQKHSYLFELRGDPHGTRFGPKSRPGPGFSEAPGHGPGS